MKNQLKKRRKPPLDLMNLFKSCYLIKEERERQGIGTHIDLWFPSQADANRWIAAWNKTYQTKKVF